MRERVITQLVPSTLKFLHYLRMPEHVGAAEKERRPNAFLQ